MPAQRSLQSADAGLSYIDIAVLPGVPVPAFKPGIDQIFHIIIKIGQRCITASEFRLQSQIPADRFLRPELRIADEVHHARRSHHHVHIIVQLHDFRCLESIPVIGLQPEAWACPVGQTNPR